MLRRVSIYLSIYLPIYLPIPFTQLPLMLTSCFTIEQLSKLRKSHWYKIINLNTDSIWITSFSTMSFFCSRVQSKIQLSDSLVMSP